MRAVNSSYLKERQHVEDLEVDGQIICNSTVNK